MKKITIFSLLLFLLVLSSCSTPDSTVEGVTATTDSITTSPVQSERITLKGTYVCLPHKDGSALAADECAPGFQTEKGEYYGFDLGLSSMASWDLKVGEPLIASGQLMPSVDGLALASGVQWEKYPVEKIFFANIKLKHEFNFIFTYGFGPIKNELNTLQSTFTKDMITDSAILVPLELSDEEVQSVQDKIEALNLFKEDPKYGYIRTVTSPCEVYSLNVFAASSSASMEWDCDHTSAARTEFVDFMTRFIDSQQEVQALPEPKGGYM